MKIGIIQGKISFTKEERENFKKVADTLEEVADILQHGDDIEVDDDSAEVFDRLISVAESVDILYYYDEKPNFR